MVHAVHEKVRAVTKRRQRRQAGGTGREIAQHMARPLGTVKAWTRRSLMRLKGCMEALA